MTTMTSRGLRTGFCPHLAQRDRLSSDKPGVQPGLAIFETHLNRFLKIPVEFVQTLSLTMRPGKARNVANNEARAGAPFYDRRECSHVTTLPL